LIHLAIARVSTGLPERLDFSSFPLLQWLLIGASSGLKVLYHTLQFPYHFHFREAPFNIDYAAAGFAVDAACFLSRRINPFPLGRHRRTATLNSSSGS
jgi:hypothetical protein